MARARFLIAVALVAVAGQAQIPTCPGSGLSVSGGRLGDAWSLGLTGPPGAAAVLASDASGGPVATPFGSVCLGLSPSLVTSPATLDAAGNFGLSGVLPIGPAFPVGSTLFTQAALAHPSLPGGYSITNGAAVTFRKPKLAVFRGGANPILYLVDGVTDAITFSTPLPGWQYGPALHVPRLGWFAWKSPDNAVKLVDDTTGVNVLTIPGAWTPNPPIQGTMAVSDDGSHLFVSDIAILSTIQNTFVLTVKTYALPSGALLTAPTITVTGAVHRGLHPIPGTSIVYALFQNKIHVVDGTAGLNVATITLPGHLNGYGEHYAFSSPGRIWVVVGGSLYGIDTSTHAIVEGPVTLGAAAIPLAIGPGASGPALWAGVTPAGAAYSLVKISLQNLAVQTVAPLTTPPYAPSVAASAGGTSMLLTPVVAPIGGMLLEVNATTNAVTPVISGTAVVAALRSDTLTKAYVYGPLGLVSFPTDPYLGAGVIIPIPGGATQVRLLSN